MQNANSIEKLDEDHEKFRVDSCLTAPPPRPWNNVFFWKNLCLYQNLVVVQMFFQQEFRKLACFVISAKYKCSFEQLKHSPGYTWSTMQNMQL